MKAITPQNAYLRARETTDPKTQVIMLYAAVINYIKQAKIALNTKDYDTAGTLIEKSLSIIRGLRLALNFDIDSDIAGALDKYYDSLDKLILAVLCNHKPNLCDAIVANLTTIQQTWEEMS